ncbi:MAG: homocysteine S-methyltransferase family protein [Clostridia bacterium]|nr:homocysteine S-methyltransferase family protein [Clostridia bacterium]
MGTVLQQKGLAPGVEPSSLVFSDPGLIESVHRSYIEAGAQVIYSDTFGANRFKLGDSAAECVKKAVGLAKRAAGDRALAALDIGPLGRLVEPTGDLELEEAYAAFREMIEAGRDADLVVFETFTDLAELRQAVIAAKDLGVENVLCTLSFEPDGRTFSGNTPQTAAAVLDGLGVSAIGVNCSSGPEGLSNTVRMMRQVSDLPIAVKPNAGLPDPVTGAYSLSPEKFASETAKLAASGASLFGGCCGTTPEHIKALKNALDSSPAAIKPEINKFMVPFVCSATRLVKIDDVRIIGERINPTGKKKMKEALTRGDMEYIKEQAVEQAQAGAAILDVNVGLPGTDEKALMTEAVKAVQSVSDLPLQLDSSSPEALEAGLRAACGKVIVNSVNGKRESIEAVLPLVKKYGACVVGLTLDENGIPETAEERFEVARRIAEACDRYGIKRSDLFIDCLTLTAATGERGALETLGALKLCRERLGVKTVLGVSNVSFGLPERELLNRSFLSMALFAGLDLPIMNPNIPSMTDTVGAFRALKGTDRSCRDYVAAHADAAPQTQSEKNLSLGFCIEKGLKGEAAKAAKKLLESVAPLDAVQEHIVPALDAVGESFEKGKTFLPQLIQAASAAQAAFDEVRQKLPKEASSGGKIIMATVKNDVHDIGKNIVCTLLSNYGFDVIDLGRDVAPETVIDAVKREGCRFVGLSALMTTTVPSMEETIALIKKEAPDCRVMVGGAVLTAEHAERIGADFYARDAKSAVDIAKRFFGEQK